MVLKIKNVQGLNDFLKTNLKFRGNGQKSVHPLQKLKVIKPVFPKNNY